MVNYDIIFAIIFYGFIILFFIKNRNKFEVQGGIFALYKTQLGIKLMEKFSKFFPKFLKFLGLFGVLIGFIGMIFIFFILVEGAIKIFTLPGAPPSVAPLLPGIQIPGLPRLSFWHWIISIFVVAVIHEFSHGVFSKLYKVKVKSSGFAFLGPILAAFVEPDEKQMIKKNKLAQLSIFAAGPFSNIILAFLIFLIAIFLVFPVSTSLIQSEGVQITSLEKDYPAINSGMKQGDVITSVNNIKVNNVEGFINILKEVKPNEQIILTTNESSFTMISVANPKNNDKGYIGVAISPVKVGIKESFTNKYGNFLPRFLFWFSMLLQWIFVISFGIGLFNLLPLGPIDGGRMFRTLLSYFIKDDKKLNKIFLTVSLFSLLLIILNLMPFIIKLISFIFTPFKI